MGIILPANYGMLSKPAGAVGGTSPSILGTGAYDYHAGTDPADFSHTLSSGSNRIVFVSVHWRGSPTVSSVTYDYGGAGAVAMTLGLTVPEQYTNPYKMAIYYVLEANLPTTGAKTVRVDYSSTPDRAAAYAFSVENANQTFQDSGTHDATGTTASVTVTVSNGSLLLSWAVSVNGGFGTIWSYTDGTTSLLTNALIGANSAWYNVGYRSSTETDGDDTVSGTGTNTHVGLGVISLAPV